MPSSISVGTQNISGNVAVNVNSIGLPKPSATQTLINKSYTGQNNGYVIHTVTAGKTFYCLGMENASSILTQMQISSDGVAVLNTVTGANMGHCSSGGILFTTASTKQITVTGGGVGGNSGTLWGYEE